MLSQQQQQLSKVEPNLKYKLLCAIDGNSPLKPVGENCRHGTTLRDQRRQRMDIWVSAEGIDIFKDEHIGTNVRRSCILLVLRFSIILESRANAPLSSFVQLISRTKIGLTWMKTGNQRRTYQLALDAGATRGRSPAKRCSIHSRPPAFLL